LLRLYPAERLRTIYATNCSVRRHFSACLIAARLFYTLMLGYDCKSVADL
jgi:hypothetical protein